MHTPSNLFIQEKFTFEIYTNLYYFMFNFYQINKNGKIWTRNRFVIKTLIPYQVTNSTQKFRLLDEISKYNLYYLNSWSFDYKNFDIILNN